MFREKWDMEYGWYISMLPFSLFTSPAGCANLAAHFSLDTNDSIGKQPDLGTNASLKLHTMLIVLVGPKMYVASADVHCLGSTKAHIDLTSAINIMVHADKKSSGAMWTIFPRKDLESVMAFVQDKHPDFSDYHPIIHEHFFSESDLAQLADQGIHAYHFQQLPGEAVLIPAGCVHQVIGLFIIGWCHLNAIL
jgi:hypothetical protein